MKKLHLAPPDTNSHLVYLTTSVISNLIETLPSGTAYFVGVTLIAMMTGRIVASRGSLARAVFPLVVHIRWGWHRVERSLERGKFSLDELIEKSYHWSLQNLEPQEVHLGVYQRKIAALDSSTIVRRRSQSLRAALLGKGYCHEVGKAVKANLVAALVTVAFIGRIRVPLLRMVRFAKSEEAAVARLFEEVNKLSGYYLIVVDAKIATQEQFAKATEEKALAGRLRKNVKLRMAPKQRKKKGRGRPMKHGAILRPGKDHPGVKPDEDFKMKVEGREIRVRRWNGAHFEGHAEVALDVLRIDDPKYKKPLLVGTTARELSTEELLKAYPHRWPVETLFYVGEATTGSESVRAWSEKAVERRIGLGLMSASLLKAIAATSEGIAMGPWDRKAQPTAGRLANYLHIHTQELLTLSLEGVGVRKYEKNPKHPKVKDLEHKKAA